MGILFALAKALEAKDDDTASHSLNVTKYAMLLGRQLGFRYVFGLVLDRIQAFYEARFETVGREGLGDDKSKGCQPSP